MAQYINNRKLHDTLVAWKSACRAAQDEQRPNPDTPRYVAEAVMLIARRLATKSQFCMWPWVEDMIADAMLACFKAVRLFDPTKSQNPFAYFTQVAWNAFLARINAERKQTYLRLASWQSTAVLREAELGEWAVGLNDAEAEYVRDYEEWQVQKRSKHLPQASPRR